MNEMIWIIGMTIASVLLAKMTKEELAEWFAETTGTTNPQNQINHLRCDPGKWMRTTTNKFSFCTLNDLVSEGFGIPAYFMAREGWETKQVLITKCFDTNNWELISAGCIKVLNERLRFILNETEFDAFNLTRDGSMIWWEPNPDHVKNKCRIESLQFTFDRAKKGHDGTPNTAPYSIDEKKGITHIAFANDI